MKLLLDTQLLLWASGEPERLSASAAAMIRDETNLLCFSVASIWEVAIKAGLRPSNFKADAHRLRRALTDNGYVEIPINGAHAAAVQSLPDLHKDPFDRLLVAQAMVEGILLITADAKLAGYPGPIRRV